MTVAIVIIAIALVIIVATALALSAKRRGDAKKDERRQEARETRNLAKVSELEADKQSGGDRRARGAREA